MNTAISALLLVSAACYANSRSPPLVSHFCTTPQGTVLTPVGDCRYFDLSAGEKPPSHPVASKKCQEPLLFDTRICNCNWRSDPDYECRARYPYVEPTTKTVERPTAGPVTEPKNHDPHTVGVPPKSCYTGDVPDYYLTPKDGCQEFDITLAYDPDYVPTGMHSCKENNKFDLRLCTCNHDYLVGSNCMSQAET